MLKKAGYKVEVANNGLEAVEKYTNRPDAFDLIFMDVQMPEMDGMTATLEIRAKGFKKIPIVAMTANAMKGDREKCIEAGMNDYLTKPIKREPVFEVLERLVFTKEIGESKKAKDIKKTKITGKTKVAQKTKALNQKVKTSGRKINMMDFKQMGEKLGMEEDEFMELVDLFMESGKADYERMIQAIAEGDPKNTASSAHTLAGASGNLGIMEIHKLAKQIENAAAGGILDGLAEISAKISDLFNDIEAAAKN
jgi:CheY-like chemotaxis protein/HPt (histidine-containing phosphotransfer) domain-containing protein